MDHGGLIDGMLGSVGRSICCIKPKTPRQQPEPCSIEHTLHADPDQRTFLVLSRSRACVKGLYSPDMQRTATATGPCCGHAATAALGPRARAARAAVERRDAAIAPVSV